MVSALKTVVSRKISASGLKVMSVPVPLALPMTSSFLMVLPRSNSILYSLPVSQSPTMFSLMKAMWQLDRCRLNALLAGLRHAR